MLSLLVLVSYSVEGHLMERSFRAGKELDAWEFMHMTTQL